MFSEYSDWVLDIKWPSYYHLKSCNVLVLEQMLKPGKKEKKKEKRDTFS